MTEYEKFGFAVDLLVEANEAFRKRPEMKNLFRDLSRDHYAGEMATVHVNSNRRAGKTNYINLKATECDLIVVGEPIIPRYDNHATVCAAKHLEDLPEGRFRRIYVDEPLYLFKAINREAFYRALCKDADQTFIFLGRN